MKLYLRLEAPYEWVRVSGHKVEAFGEVPGPADFPVRDDDTLIGVVPGEWVTTQVVNLPAKTRKQFNAALPYALEESITQELEELYFVCADWKPAHDSVVHIIARTKMSEWQGIANEHSLPIMSLVPDRALVPFHEASDFSLAVAEDHLDDRVMANQRNGLSHSLDHVLIDLWLKELPADAVIAVNDEPLAKSLSEQNSNLDVRYWSFGNKLAHWLEYPSQISLNLWGEDYRPKIGLANLTVLIKPALLVVIALMAFIGFDVYRYFDMHREIKAIHLESQDIIDKHFPDFGDVQDGFERGMMERGIASMAGPRFAKGLPPMLAQVSSVLNRQGVTLSEINYRDEQLIISCVLRDLSQVDAINQQLNARPGIAASVQGSESEKGRIIASYRVTQT